MSLGEGWLEIPDLGLQNVEASHFWPGLAVRRQLGAAKKCDLVSPPLEQRARWPWPKLSLQPATHWRCYRLCYNTHTELAQSQVGYGVRLGLGLRPLQLDQALRSRKKISRKISRFLVRWRLKVLRKNCGSHHAQTAPNKFIILTFGHKYLNKIGQNFHFKFIKTLKNCQKLPIFH